MSEKDWKQEKAKRKVTEMFEQKLLRDLVHRGVYEQKFIDILNEAEEHFNSQTKQILQGLLHEFQEVKCRDCTNKPSERKGKWICNPCLHKIEKEITRLKAELINYKDRAIESESREAELQKLIRKKLEEWKDWNMKCYGDERYNWMESFDGYFAEWLKKEASV